MKVKAYFPFWKVLIKLRKHLDFYQKIRKNLLKNLKILPQTSILAWFLYFWVYELQGFSILNLTRFLGNFPSLQMCKLVKILQTYYQTMAFRQTFTETHYKSESKEKNNLQRLQVASSNHPLRVARTGCPRKHDSCCTILNVFFHNLLSSLIPKSIIKNIAW